jgi:glycerol-3-phosphate dehydrogenase
LTVNATGAAVDRLLKPLGLSARLPLLKAMNLVTTRHAADEALGGLSISGRPLFLVPWRGRAVFGTWESKQPVTAAETGVDRDEVTEFIDDLNQAFPALDLEASDVSLVHRGLVPAAVRRDGSIGLEGHEQTRDHAVDGIEGLMSVAGTKYTTARAVAERLTDRVLEKLGRSRQPCRTAVTPLPGGDFRNVPRATDDARREYGAQLPHDTIAHLIAAYGSRFRDVIRASAGQPASLMRLSQSSPVIGAELIWAARREMAVTLQDAVVRRTPLGALGHPGDPAALCAAAIMAGEHKWSPEQTAAELSSLRGFYQS